MKFTKNELLFNDTDIYIVANPKEGSIALEIKGKTEDAYRKALTFIENLLSKGFSNQYGGYFLTKDGDSSHYSFQAASLFDEAVKYPNLHPLIEKYYWTAQQHGGLYNESDTPIGYYAAQELVDSSENYLGLASDFFTSVDSEHVSIHSDLLDSIESKYGFTDKSMEVIIDGIKSLNQVFLPTLIENEQNMNLFYKHLKRRYSDEIEQVLNIVFEYTPQQVADLEDKLGKTLVESILRLWKQASEENEHSYNEDDWEDFDIDWEEDSEDEEEEEKNDEVDNQEEIIPSIINLPLNLSCPNKDLDAILKHSESDVFDNLPLINSILTRLIESFAKLNKEEQLGINQFINDIPSYQNLYLLHKDDYIIVGNCTMNKTKYVKGQNMIIYPSSILIMGASIVTIGNAKIVDSILELISQSKPEWVKDLSE